MPKKDSSYKEQEAFESQLKNFSKYSSKVKDIYLALPDFKYFHSPSGLTKEYHRFVGRKYLIEKLKNILSKADTKAGAYLITGYRGVGKTSLVRKVLQSVRDVDIRGLFWSLSLIKSLILVGVFIAAYLLVAQVNCTVSEVLERDFIAFKETLVAQWFEGIRAKFCENWISIRGVLLISVLVYFVALLSVYYRQIGRFVRKVDKNYLRRLFVKSKFAAFLNDRKSVVVELSLAQSELKDIDILQLLTKNFYDHYKVELKPFKSISNLIHSIVKWILSICVFLLVFQFFQSVGTIKIASIEIDQLWSGFSGAGIVSSLFFRHYQTLFAAFNIVTPEAILRQLKRLNEMVKGNVTMESGSTSEAGFLKYKFSVAKKRTNAYPQATARTIEAELVTIMRNMASVSWIYRKLEFVFVFDELDKIEVHGTNDENASFEEQNNFGPEYSRKRQESIALLLGNLKHFLNVARAKFIFVASREMYDVFLADISDRDGYIGSVFHDVINVPSFFSESYTEKSTDITRLTEEYVCQFLIPERWLEGNNLSHEPKSLSLYRKYLSEEDLFPNGSMSDWEKEAWQQKVVFTLRQFIIYLVYRSNGAPKSVTRLFESFIRSPKLKDHTEDNKLRDVFSLVVCSEYNKDSYPESLQDFYLHFDALQQYKFGFTNYIFTQFLVAKSKYMRDFGDKLLVSAAYLLDHLYKFHNVAFSWHHLEQTPEMLDINKSPALRGFMEEMVKSLSNIHVREIVSGLYQFKFYKRIANEIDYISKISEMEAAAFNFTLDEHLQIKRYYQVKLKDFQKNLAEAYSGKSSGKSLYSLAELHMTLGDLHFYDQEFEEAKRHFTDAIRILKGQSPVESTNVHQFMLMLRNQLKLGLAHEKTQNFSAATAEYGNVSLDVAKWRDLEFKHLGLVKAILHLDQVPDFVIRFERNLMVLTPDSIRETKKYESYGNWTSSETDDSREGQSEDDRIFSYINDTERRLCRPITEDRFRILYYLKRLFGKRETMTFYGWPKKSTKAKYPDGYYMLEGISRFHTFSRLFISSMEKLPASAEKETVYMKKIVFESFRLVHQPLLAKLHSIEKGSMGGVTYSDLKRNLKEFEYLSRAAWHDEKHLLEAEYYNKVGNLLFYKNGHAFGQYGETSQRLTYLQVRNINDLNKYEIHKDYKAPIAAYQYYRNSLEIIKNRVIEYREGPIEMYSQNFSLKEEKELMASFLGFLRAEKLNFPTIQNTLMESIGNTFSDLGNTILASIGCPHQGESDENLLTIEFLETLFGKSSKSTSESKKEATLLGKETLLEVLQHYIGYQADTTGTPSLVSEIPSGASSNDMPRLETALLCYSISGMYFERANRHRKHAFQNLKILYVLKDYLNSVKHKKDKAEVGRFKSLLPLLEAGLLHKTLRAIHRTNDNAARFEIEYYKQVFASEKKKEIPDSRYQAILNNVSNTPEIREALILFSELKLIVDEPGLTLPNSFLLNAYSGINSQYTRVLELKYKTHVNNHYFQKLASLREDKPLIDEEQVYKRLLQDFQLVVNKPSSDVDDALRFLKRLILLSTCSNLSEYLANYSSELIKENKIKEEVCLSISELLRNKKRSLSENLHHDFLYLKISDTGIPEDIKDYFKDIQASQKEAVFHLVTDSIVCLSEVINSFKVYGASYMVTHSRIGFTHLALAKWCSRFDYFMNDLGLYERVDIDTYLSRLLESNGRISMVPSYHYEQAIKHFYYSLQVHNEGDGYKGKLYNMYYLEDDFNDNLYHFGAAVERYKINTKVIREKIEECRDHLKKNGDEGAEGALDIYSYSKYM